MLRILQATLTNWFKGPTRKPLVLRGARQVGKSTLVRQFAKDQKLRLHEVNLELHKHLRPAITSLSVAAFLNEVQLTCKNGAPLGDDSLLFIDEIQEIPEALTLLRYLYEEKPDLAVIAAGSLLEFALASEDRSFSMLVGRIEYAFLGPCSST